VVSGIIWVCLPIDIARLLYIQVKSDVLME